MSITDKYSFLRKVVIKPDGINWNKYMADYIRSTSRDKDIISNLDRLYDIKLIEEMVKFGDDRVMTLGYALLIKDKEKWNYPGSAKARRIKAGVKHIKN